MPPFKLSEKPGRPEGGFSEYAALRKLTGQFERPLESTGSSSVRIDPLGDRYVRWGKEGPVASILPGPRASDASATVAVSPMPRQSFGSVIRGFLAMLVELWNRRFEYGFGNPGPVLMLFAFPAREYHQRVAAESGTTATEFRSTYDQAMSAAGRRVRINQKIQEVVAADWNFKDPMAIWDPIAKSFGLDKMAYMGVLLEKAEAVEVNTWLESLRPKNNNVRDQAAFKILAIDWVETHQIKQCIPRLKDYLRDPSEEVRLRAAQVLLRFGETEGVVLVLTNLVLKSEDAEVSLKAIETLRLIDPRKTSVVFVEAATKGDSDLRIEALEALQQSGRLNSQTANLQALFQVYEHRVQVERRMDDLLEQVSEALRLAIVLQKLGNPTDVSALFETFLARYRPKSKIVDSQMLEKTMQLYAAATGERDKPLLFKLATDNAALPAVQSGAILALGQGFVPAFASERLLKVLSNPHLDDGIRISALEVLLKKDGVSPELLRPWALALAESPHLFVKMRAIDALIELKEDGKVKSLLMGLQSVPWTTWLRGAEQAVKTGDPFARHEESAFDKVEAWKLRTMDRLDPQWREPLQAVGFAEIMKMVEEQLYQREQFKLPSELDPLVKANFDWAAFRAASRDNLFVAQVELAQAVLDFSSETRMSETEKRRIFKNASQSAVAALAGAAARHLTGVEALLTLHHSGNSYAKSALLSLDIRPFLRRIEEEQDQRALLAVHRLAATDIAHRQAQLVVTQLPKNPLKNRN